MKYNYHTHTFRCHHARGEDEDYVLAAIKAGYDEIGFSDHCAWPYEGGFVSGMRMTVEQIDEYVRSVKSLREKYSDRIKIKLGFECEYFPQYLDWMKQIIKEYGFDYIILGHHFCKSEKNGTYNGDIKRKRDLTNYKNDILKALDSGLFSYVAHPDIYMRGYPAFDSCCEAAAREIIAKSLETKTPIEYNLLGLAHGKADGKIGYPHPEFWRIAGEMGAVAVIGIDAHYPEAYFDEALQCQAKELLTSLGVKLTDKIRMF